MKPSHLRGTLASLSRSRRAMAQPRFLLATAAMATVIGGFAYLATAQNAKSAKPSVESSSAKFGARPVQLSDLAPMVAAYGANGGAAKYKKIKASKAALSKSRTVASSGFATSQAVVNANGTASGFNLSEVDLTPGSISDDREPTYSPTGETIAFRSNGALDANGKLTTLNAENKFHIWLMDADGSELTQITGLTASDKNLNQYRPSWSPNGNQLTYVSGTSATATNDQLFVVDATGTGIPTQITFYSGQKSGPAWGTSGIIYASNTLPASLSPSTATPLASFDLIEISPDGTNPQQLTGTTTDAGGVTADDLNPAYSGANPNVVYFSSNRDSSGTIATGGRRIWSISTSGGAPTQLTDPPNDSGKTVVDDFPTSSLTKSFSGAVTKDVNEQLAFQSNRLVDSSDTTADLNIWALPATQQPTPTPVSTSTPVPTATAGPTPTATPFVFVPTPTPDPFGGFFSTPTPVPQIRVEQPGQAYVITNALSSPNNASQVTITNADGTVVSTEDKADDVEPTFTRSTATAAEIAHLAFSSTRVYGANPSLSGKQNPYGFGADGTHDIWATQTVDTTPPTIVTQGQYPVVGPHTGDAIGGQRTYEEGLRPGAPLMFGVALSDQESGISLDSNSTAISISLHLADSTDPARFVATPDVINASYTVPVSVEVAPPITVSYPLHVTDGGPAGGEKEAGAVAGDGIYYCYTDASAVTPSVAGDYYIDVNVKDQSGNSFTYDNIWGISTQAFQNTGKDLFVSDYTCGQLFPNVLAQTNSYGDDGRFANMFPVESYLLNNPANIGMTNATPPVLFLSNSDTFTNVSIWRTICRGPVPQSVIDSRLPTITKQVDPDEGLAATPVPTAIPSATGTPVPTSTPVPTPTPISGAAYTSKTRSVLVATGQIIWAAPYAGTTFTGPGSITDPQVQSQLSNFSDAGGRLFVTGRDVAWALSNSGQAQNDFLANVLGANFSKEYATNPVNAPGITIDDANPGGVGTPGDETKGGFLHRYGVLAEQRSADVESLQIPFHYDGTKPTQHWTDAALNQDPNAFVATVNDLDGSGILQQAVGVRPDIFTPSGASGVTTNAAYTIAGGLTGQRVSRSLPNGTEARSVFFGFGLEAVNRRYRAPSTDWGQIALDARFNIASQIGYYLKSGSMSGNITNGTTNAPIANFLVEATEYTTGQTFLVRTDTSGNYSLLGLPEGDYIVNSAILDSSGKVIRPFLSDGTLNNAYTAALTSGNFTTSPAGYDPGTPRGTITGQGVQGGPEVLGGGNTFGVNLRPIPFAPGSVRGTVAATSLSDSTTTSPINGLNVLLVSTTKSVSNPGGGYFVSVVKTNSSGLFAFSSVPSKTGLIVVLNPSLDYKIPGLGDGSITVKTLLTTAGLIDTYQDTTTKADKINNPAFGTRTITSFSRPTDDSTILMVGPGASFILNDGANGASFTDTASADGKTTNLPNGNPLILDRFLATLNGKVTVNGVGVAGVGVELLDSSGNPLTPDVAATTDSSGSYTLNSVPAGSYTVKATFGISTGTAAVTVTNNPTVAVPLIKLTQNIISGKVTINGVAAPGVKVQLLTSAGKAYSPARTATTDAKGAYTLSDFPAGTYLVQATSGSSTASVTVKVTTTPKVTAPTINLVVNIITGKVTINGKAAAGVTVQLFVSTTKAYSPTRTTTTDSSGSYTLSDFPQGTYIVKATSGANSGTTTVKVSTNPKVTASTINIVQSVITGTVYTGAIGPNGTTRTKLAGATVTLLSGGKSVATTTTASDGTYSFLDQKAGSYTVKASFSGFSSPVSASFTTSATGGQAPDLVISSFSITGTVVNSSGTKQSGATVQLLKSGSVVATTTTDSNGAFTFNSVAAGSYTVTATLSIATGSTTVTIQSTDTKVPAVKITLATDPTLVGTTFDVVGQTYLISIPYEDTNNPSSSNVSEATNGLTPATTKVKFAFTVLPNDPTTGAENFTLEQYDPKTLTFTKLTNDSVITRGFGYRLVVTHTGTMLKLPTTDSTRVALTSATTAATFTVTLHTAGAGSTSNSANGENLIGFGLDPSTFTSVSFDNVIVTNPNGQTVTGIDAAVAQGWIVLPITTYDNGSSDVADEFLPYHGYFVKTTVDGLKLTLQSATNFAPFGSYFVSFPYTTTDSTTTNGVGSGGTITVDQAFSSPLSSGLYNLYSFNAGGQINKRGTLAKPSTDLVQITSGSTLLVRGQGYLLKTLNGSVYLRTPSQSSALSAYTGTSFSIPLTWNTNFLSQTTYPNNQNNGYNFIGFPFDPATYKTVDFSTAQVTFGSKTYTSLAAAAGAGIIDQRLYTLDANNNFVVVNSTTLKPYQSYFVHILRYDPTFKLILNNPS